MIGLIGFIIAAAAITSFVWSNQKVYTTVEPTRLKLFNVAFGLIAIAMLFWATIVAANDAAITQRFMVASDCLIGLGSLCMFLVIFRQFSALVLSLLGGVLAVFVSYRAYVQVPTAYVHNGLLYFNLQGSSRLLIIGLFAIIWLPAMMLVANDVANHPAFHGKRLSLQMYFVFLVALLALFAKARRPGAIIGLFAMIVLVFVVLTVLNLTLAKIEVPSTQLPKEPARKQGSRHG